MFVKCFRAIFASFAKILPKTCIATPISRFFWNCDVISDLNVKCLTLYECMYVCIYNQEQSTHGVAITAPSLGILVYCILYVN